MHYIPEDKSLHNYFKNVKQNKKNNYVALVHKLTIPTERPPLVGEVRADFRG
jgi:hypothetical protein